MKRVLLYTVLFILLVDDVSPWILEKNKEYVAPGSTKNVQLTCKIDYNQDHDNFKTITRIRITKGAVSPKLTLVDFRVNSNELHYKNTSIIATSHVNTSGVTFLEVTWPTATKDTVGVFGCEISGFDRNDNFNSLLVTQQTIKLHSLTFEEVKTFVRSVTSSYEIKQRGLEADILSLKGLLASLLATFRQLRKDDLAKLRAEMANAKNQLESNYVTNEKLSKKISNLTLFTIDEIRNGNQKVEQSHRNRTIDLERNVTKLQTTVLELKDNFTNEIESLKVKNKCCSQIDSRLNNVTTYIESINKKYEDIMRNNTSLRKLILEQCDNICKVNCTELPPQQHKTSVQPNTFKTDPNPIWTTRLPDNSTTTPNVTISDKWPDGTYALVKPKTGCPEFMNLKILTYQDFFVPSENVDLNYVNLPKYHLHSDTDSETLDLCLKDQPTSNLDTDWPKGSYCIHRYRGRCPNHFASGKIQYWVKSFGKDVGYIPLTFCCRSDGNPATPIRIPKKKPFYLYRYKSTCQKVEGMVVSTDDVTISFDINQNAFQSMKSSSSFIHPDTERLGTPIYLCYYQPE